MRSNIDKLDLSGSSDVEAIMKKGRDSVADGLAYLTSTQVQNFYARVISGLDRMAVPGLGTMAVTAVKGKYLLMYDPVFAGQVSYEELCATLEHEVYHILLEHIPRLMAITRLATASDMYLHKMVANLAMDAAANALLVQSWPKMRDPSKPLGYWVLPEGFQPPLPPEMAFEQYHKLLFDTLKNRLKTDPKELYQMAAAMIKDAADKGQQAKQQLQKGQQGQQNQQGQQGQQDQQGQSGEQQQQQGQQGQQGQSQGSQQAQDQQPGQGGSGSGPKDTNPFEGMSPGELKEKAESLDPIDQEVLKMLLSSMKSHCMIDEEANDESDSHKLQEHGRDLIKSAAQAHKKSRGTMPGHLEELIKYMLMPPTVPWTQFLHNIVQRTRQTKKERGMSRPSKIISAMRKYAQLEIDKADGDLSSPLLRKLVQFRRVPPFPGIKQDNKYTIVYAVDTSGSMSHAELEKGLSELQHLQKSDSDISICVIYADTAVCKEFWIDATTPLDRSLTGRGGTDFDAVFEHTAKLMGSPDKSPDLLVYCTDGYAPPPTVKIPIPTVWLLTPHGSPVMKDAGHITIQMRDYQLGESY